MEFIDSEILEAVVADAPGYVIVLDVDLRIEYINCSGAGGRADNFVGTPILSYLPPDEQSENEALLREVLDTGETRTSSVVLPSLEGEPVYYEAIAVPLKVKGEIRGVTLHARDCSAHALAEEQRAALQALMEKAEVVSHFGSFEVQLAPEGDRVYLSKQLYRILGIDPARDAPPVTVHLEKYTHPDDRERVRSVVQGAVQHGVPFEVDYRTITPAGAVRWLRSKTEPMLDEQGTTTALVGIVHDITEERRADAEKRLLEAQLRQSQKMEAVGTLASGVAHDFNNLLMGVSGCARIALDKLPDDSASRSLLEEILRAVQSGAAITKQLLTFARERPAEPQVFDLSVTVSGQQTMLTRLLGEQIELVVDLQKAPCWIRLDPTQLEQVLMNLAVNARDAMPDGGRLTIVTQTATTRSARGHDGVQVSLVVSDTGMGMSEAICDRIFEPFFTTKEVGEGTGLGLSTAYAIVQQAGGDIQVESREGEGTTFRICLPEAEAPAAEQVAPAPERIRTESPESATLLLVEDDALVRLSTVYYLKEAGYHVLEAAGGAEAIACWQAYPGEIDVLITDVVLPKMSGPQLAREIQELTPEVRLLFMSAHSPEWLAAKWQFEPDARLLQKPFDRDALVSELREMLALA